MVIILSSGDFHRRTIFDAGSPLSKNGYLSQRTPRFPRSLAAISSILHRQTMVMRSGREWHFAGNVPDEADEFSSDCCQNTRLRLSSTRTVAIAFAESRLRFPAYLSDRLRHVSAASQKRMLFTRRVTIRKLAAGSILADGIIGSNLPLTPANSHSAVGPHKPF